MARISLKCSCGWSFFLAESTQGSQVTCPNCSSPVDIPGRVAGQERLTPGEIAAKKIQQARTTKMLVGAVVGVVLLGAIIVWQIVGGGDDQQQQQTRPRPGARRTPGAYPSSQYPTSTPITPGAAPATTPRPSANPFPTRPSTAGTSGTKRPAVKESALKIDVPFLITRITERIWYVNMRGIVAEVLRLKGLPQARAAVLQKMQEDEANIQSMLKKLAYAGAQMDVPGRMKADDKILSVGLQPVAGVRVMQGRAVLEQWLRKFQPPVLIEEIHVQRGAQRLALYVGFPKETKELLKLARYPDTLGEGTPPLANLAPGAPAAAVPGTPAPAINPNPAVLAMPGDVLEDIKQRLELLPRGYFLLLAPTDRSKLGRLQKALRGTPTDIQFLNNLQQKVLRRFEAEAADFRSKVRSLEAKVLKGSVSVDVIHFKDGRKIQGKVVEQTDTQVTVELRFGKVKYPKSDILRIEPGSGKGGEFPGRYAKAKGNPKAMDELLQWCTEHKLRLEREFVGYLILTEDPTHDGARKVVRRPRPMSFVGSSSVSPRSVRRSTPAGAAAVISPNQAVARRIEGIARDVAGAHPRFSDVVVQMRQRTAGLRQSAYPAPPPVALRIAGTITNPLEFDPGALPPPKAIELAKWWLSLNSTDRQAFASYFGLWCAYTRSR